IQELNDLGELSPHWDNLRRDVITRYSHLIKTYQETLAELEKFTVIATKFRLGRDDKGKRSV
ncbi:type II inositol 3,4-bisphosphate 4-phosphatase isoform X1, partial [Tachysurus ichikawai]